ncbi:MAG TPA: NfeD family protein [Clostridiales bacterium]|nr:NfeD family protein [Clostridiales bacterium]
MELAAFVWLGLMVLFLIMEGATVSLVSLWFAAGAMIAMFAALLGAGFWLQMVLFLVVSGALLLMLRPIVRRFLLPKITPTNVDSVVGTIGLVTEAVDNVTAAGQVKLDAMEWTARSTTGEDIPVGTLVRVDRIEGVKAFVTPVKVPERV